MLLALDLATNTGFCRGVPGGPVTVGTITLPSTGNDVGTFLNAYANWLRPVLQDGITTVVFESPSLRSGGTQLATLRKLYSLAGVTEMACQTLNIPVFEERLQTVKKTLAGNGRAEKADMIEAAKLRGVPVTDDNQADAFGIWLCAVHNGWRDSMALYDPLNRHAGNMALTHVCAGKVKVSAPAPRPVKAKTACGAESVEACKNHDKPGAPWCASCKPPGVVDMEHGRDARDLAILSACEAGTPIDQIAADFKVSIDHVREIWLTMEAQD